MCRIVNMEKEKYILWSVYKEKSPHGESIDGRIYTEESKYKKMYIQKKHK